MLKQPYALPHVAQAMAEVISSSFLCHSRTASAPARTDAIAYSRPLIWRHESAIDTRVSLHPISVASASNKDVQSCSVEREMGLALDGLG
jgi:hypothetical protein